MNGDDVRHHGDVERVTCRRVDGVTTDLDLTVVADGEPSHAGLPTRTVRTPDGTLLLQKWVPRTADGRAGPLDALDRDIRAAIRFHLVFGPDQPHELPRLRYYDVDGPEPFALFEPYRGVPVRSVLDSIDGVGRPIQVGLLRALHLANVADVTHGAVGLDALRWDADTDSVQLVDFERSERLGAPRAADGRAADVRDDVWDAGLTVWRTRRPGHIGREAPRFEEDLPSGDALRELLAGVFVEPSAARPTPGEMLARVRESVDLPAELDLGARLNPGRRAFDAAVERKVARLRDEAAAAAKQRPWWKRLWDALRGAPARTAAWADGPAAAAGPDAVQCPVCLDRYRWNEQDPLYIYDEDQQAYVRPEHPDAMLSVVGYRQCPNPSGSAPPHFLPAAYHRFGAPIVVAVIGRGAAGKTHLVASMIREVLERDQLSPYGLEASPLDLRRHARVRQEYFQRMRDGQALHTTEAGIREPFYILRLSGSFGQRPVAFFDVSGEDLTSVREGDQVGRFLLGANALMFVHGLSSQPKVDGDLAFEVATNRLRANDAFRKIPTVVVATKADRFRYEPPVDRWLRTVRDPLARPDGNTVHAESRDVYAYLYARDEHAAIAPYGVFDRVSLHLASGSGGEKDAKDSYPRGLRPVRVLDPLLSLLAMHGLIAADNPNGIGR